MLSSSQITHHGAIALVKPPSEVKASFDQKIEVVSDKVKDKIGIKGQIASAALGGGLPGFQPKSPEQIEAEQEIKETERLRREDSKRNEFQARAELIKFPYDKEWTTEKLELEVKNAEREFAQQKERSPLLEQAAKVGLAVEPSWDNPTLRTNVERAQQHARAMEAYEAKHEKWLVAMAEYRQKVSKGPNANCPRCKYPLRIGDANINGQGLCPRCHAIFPRRQARASFSPLAPPKEPQPPKESVPGSGPGTLERLKDKLEKFSPFSREG